MIAGVIVVPILSPFQTGSVASDYSSWRIPVSGNPDMWFAPAATTDPDTGLTHWLGTDRFGRDEMTRLFLGGRVTLASALIATVLTTTLGVLVGLVAGFYGGWVDTVFMRFTDFVLAWPLIPAYIIFISFMRNLIFVGASFDSYTELVRNLLVMLGIVIGGFVLFSWMGVARLVRGTVLTLRTQPFIEATRALGAGNSRIIFKHLLPNALSPILVAATVMVGEFILWEAALAYFGQGIPEPPAASWGNMLASAQSHIAFVIHPNPFEEIRFYIFLLPCLMVLITVLAINFIADALRAALVTNQGHS